MHFTTVVWIVLYVVIISSFGKSEGVFGLPTEDWDGMKNDQCPHGV